MSFGVVPLDTSAWKPEIAPQAIVMNTNGNSAPPKIGPLPSMNCVTAGILISGRMITTAIASNAIVPSLRNVDK
jgi:hypothetical protein